MAKFTPSLTIPEQTVLDGTLARGGTVQKRLLSYPPITIHWDSKPITTHFVFLKTGLHQTRNYSSHLCQAGEKGIVIK